MPEDVRAELAAFDATRSEPGRFRSHGGEYSHLLAVRRSPNIYNSHFASLPQVQNREPFNPAYLHPDDLAAHCLEPGDKVVITSDAGRITAIVKADRTVRVGVVSISHGRGALPEDDVPLESAGVAVNELISSQRDLDVVHVMPRMSGIPVNIEKVTDGAETATSTSRSAALAD
jgi:anaerobic selenocysteine-containing dehydrogenase